MGIEKQETMLGRIMAMIVTVPAEMLGTLCDLIEKLASKEGQKWFKNLKLFLRGDLGAVKRSKSYRFRLITEQVIPATDKILTWSGGAVWNEYRYWFEGHQEPPKPETVVEQYNLEQDSTSFEIITALGGESRVETTLVEMEHLVWDQSKPKRGGIKFVKGKSHLFFVRDKGGYLRMFEVRWTTSQSGWWVKDDVRSLGGLERFPVGTQVFIRNR